MLTTCWPYCIFRQKILEGYMKRPDVAALLDGEDGQLPLSPTPCIIAELPARSSDPLPEGSDGLGTVSRPRMRQRQE